MEVDAGANVYFIIYEDLKTGERKEMYSLAAHKAIERLVQGLPIADPKEGCKIIILSPNQLVYVPSQEEIRNPELIDLETANANRKEGFFSRIYKVVSFSKAQCFFIPINVSRAIIEPSELGSNNKAERSWDGQMIKQVFIKLNIDRLGNNIKLV